MANEGVKKYAKYFFLLSLAVIVILAFLLIKPYITSIFGGIILAYLFYPVYKFLGKFKFIRNPNVRAILVCGLIIIIILLPMIFAAQTLLKESINIYNMYIKTDSFELSRFASEEVSEFVKEAVKDVVVNISVGARRFIQILPGKVLHFFIVMFLVFYFLRDGEKFLRDIKAFIPIEKHKQEHLIKEFSAITYAVVFGLVATGVAQGVAGALGFYLFGISSPITWGLVMMVLSVLPLVGPAFVWVPVGLFYVYQGDLFTGLGILLYGALIISMLDNLVRPYLIAARTKIHPAVIFIGLIGGLNLFGFVGIVLGPLILSFLFTFLKFIE